MIRPQQQHPAASAAVLVAAFALAAAVVVAAAPATPGCAASGATCAVEAQEQALLQRSSGVQRMGVGGGDDGSATFGVARGNVVRDGDEIFLRTYTGHRITVQDTTVHAKWDHKGLWQVFVIEKEGGGDVSSGDTVMLRAHTGMRITVQDEGVHAKWDHQGSWQKLVIENAGNSELIHDGDEIYLTAWTGRRIDADGMGSGIVAARYKDYGAWQTFVIEKKEQPPTEAPTTPTTAAPTVTPEPTTTTETSPPQATCAHAYQQCGGNNWNGATCCMTGYTCVVGDEWYSQCKPAAPPPTSNCAHAYQQCGGNNWNGATCCVSGFTCVVGDEWYSQCKPNETAPPTPIATTTKEPATTTPEPSTEAPTTTAAPTTAAPTTAAPTPTPEPSTEAPTTTAAPTTAAPTTAAPTTAAPTTTPEPSTTTMPQATCAQAWQQCGGNNWNGATCCVSGYTCVVGDAWYSQCKPDGAAPPTTTAGPGTTSGAPAPGPTTTAADTGSWVTGTWTTGYWDCCKPSCSWPGKGSMTAPVRACNIKTGLFADANERSVCDGGDSASCVDNQPFIVPGTGGEVSMGFAAAAVGGVSGLHGDENCGQCYELLFVDRKHPNGNWGGSHPDLAGKRMVVQVTNIGYDVSGEHSFDIQIPGAGMGIFTSGCARQFPATAQGDVGAFDCSNNYGGCHTKDGCARLPQELRGGCEWRYDWIQWLIAGGQTNNPYVNFRRVRCPTRLTDITGSAPLDDDQYPEVSLPSSATA